eukprot:TRINITY_DN7903_c0_g2_i3.p4 TRINITY_DN7903_c0_g2~~TRINITY_DN7903_c0_g2_i3.p4  ORF type:complete len:136 (-),score=0.66 TRINITY_DN7903_c0_g2_i3:690-1097(-)
MLEIKMGLGGMSYKETIAEWNLPKQLANVDPIVAAFCGGTVGVLSTMLILETYNINSQKATKCRYCGGIQGIVRILDIITYIQFPNHISIHKILFQKSFLDCFQGLSSLIMCIGLWLQEVIIYLVMTCYQLLPDI